MFNPILPILKENDIVLFSSNNNYQIARLTNLEYIAPNETSKYNWLNYNYELLYTSVRLPYNNTNIILTNCLGICEILNDFLIQKYVKEYNMFLPTENVLSKEELEYLLNRYKG